MSNNIFTQVKEQISNVDVAKDYGIKVKRTGSHYVCLCPFHREKTPSMVLYEDGFKCFGCGEAGDAISFISKLQGLKPLDAVKDIIHRCSLPIPIETPHDTAKRTKRKKYTDRDLLNALERWRDETFPVYVEWYKAIDANVKEMNMSNPLFQALIELRGDLSYITDKQISDDFTDVLMAYEFTQSTAYELA